jgi:hypothetical protein
VKFPIFPISIHSALNIYMRHQKQEFYVAPLFDMPQKLKNYVEYINTRKFARATTATH